MKSHWYFDSSNNKMIRFFKNAKGARIVQGDPVEMERPEGRHKCGGRIAKVANAGVYRNWKFCLKCAAQPA